MAVEPQCHSLFGARPLMLANIKLKATTALPRLAHVFASAALALDPTSSFNFQAELEATPLSFFKHALRACPREHAILAHPAAASGGPL